MGWIAVPVWMLIAFHALVLALTLSHGQSVALIEDKLVAIAGLSSVSGAIGAAAGTGVTDLDILVKKPQRWGLALSTVIAYMGYFGIAVTFTVYALQQAWIGGHDVGFWLPLAIYLVCVIAEGGSVVYLFGSMRDDLKSSTVPPPAACRNCGADPWAP